MPNSPAPIGLNYHEQRVAVAILEFLSDLFTGTECELFTRDQILKLLNDVMSDSEMIDPDVLIAHQIATADLPNSEDAA